MHEISLLGGVIHFKHPYRTSDLKTTRKTLPVHGIAVWLQLNSSTKLLFGTNFFLKRFIHQYCVILEEITPATQHSSIFNEICTAVPPRLGKLLRSLSPLMNTTKCGEREQNPWEEPLTKEICATDYLHQYRAPVKSMYFLLSRTQAGPGRTVKQ